MSGISQPNTSQKPATESSRLKAVVLHGIRLAGVATEASSFQKQQHQGCSSSIEWNVPPCLCLKLVAGVGFLQLCSLQDLFSGSSS